MDFGPLRSDSGKRKGSYLELLPAPSFSWQTAEKLGNVIHSSILTQTSRYNFGFKDPFAIQDAKVTKRVLCHPSVKHGRNNGMYYSVLVDTTLYSLCESALHDVLVAARCVTSFKEWREQNSNSKGKWNMKAPKPKMAEFGNIETWKALCGGLDRPVKAKITAEPTEGKYGWQVPFQVGETDLIQTVKEESRNYKNMFDKLGDDFAGWVGKTVKVSVFKMTEGEYKGTESLRIQG